MAYQVLDKDSDNPTYVFSTFWDFVALCIRIKPGYTLRTYFYVVIGWLIGAAMGITFVQEITWKWALTQFALLVFLLAVCTAITYWSLRKEWDYLRSTNLVRTVPKDGPWKEKP
jgi:hypothetical protein